MATPIAAPSDRHSTIPSCLCVAVVSHRIKMSRRAHSEPPCKAARHDAEHAAKYTPSFGYDTYSFGSTPVGRIRTQWLLQLNEQFISIQARRSESPPYSRYAPKRFKKRSLSAPSSSHASAHSDGPQHMEAQADINDSADVDSPAAAWRAWVRRRLA